MIAGPLFDTQLVSLAEANEFLHGRHYLGRTGRGKVCWMDEFGLAVLANPSSRRLPQRRWLELVRWCLVGTENGGSQQWARLGRWLRNQREWTTVVSYSDPSAGHTGALYRACNWQWAPTWHRLRPPPSGNGRWTDGGKIEAVKDRWVFALSRDPERDSILAIQDEAIVAELGAKPSYKAFRARMTPEPAS